MNQRVLDAANALRSAECWGFVKGLGQQVTTLEAMKKALREKHFTDEEAEGGINLHVQAGRLDCRRLDVPPDVSLDGVNEDALIRLTPTPLWDLWCSEEQQKKLPDGPSKISGFWVVNGEPVPCPRRVWRLMVARVCGDKTFWEMREGPMEGLMEEVKQDRILADSPDSRKAQVETAFHHTQVAFNKWKKELRKKYQYELPWVLKSTTRRFTGTGDAWVTYLAPTSKKKEEDAT